MLLVYGKGAMGRLERWIVLERAASWLWLWIGPSLFLAHVAFLSLRLRVVVAVMTCLPPKPELNPPELPLLRPPNSRRRLYSPAPPTAFFLLLLSPRPLFSICTSPLFHDVLFLTRSHLHVALGFGHMSGAFDACFPRCVSHLFCLPAH